MKKGSNVVYTYKEIENVPNKLLDRILLGTMSRDELDVLIKENHNPKIKGLKLKYKINPKQKLTNEQIIGITLDYFENGKGNELYTAFIKYTEKRFECMLEECCDENIDIIEDFLENITVMIESIDMPLLISYIRQRCDELHKYIPALLKSWIETEDFKKYEINDLYGFSYDKTFNEEFDINLYFDCLDKDIITDKSKFEFILEEADNPIDIGISVAMEHLEILKSFAKKKIVNIKDKTKEYEKLLNVKDKELNDYKRQVKKFTDNIDKISKEKEEVSKSLEEYKRRYEDIKEKLITKEAKLEDLKKEKKLSNSQLKLLQKELEDMKNKYDNLVESKSIEITTIKESVENEKSKRLELEESLYTQNEISKLLSKENALLKERLEVLEVIEQTYKDKISELEVNIENLNHKEVVSEISTTVVCNIESEDDFLGSDFLDILSNNPTF